MRFPNPIKPWFVYRPGQLVRRIGRAVRPPSNPIQVVDLPWGCPIEVDVRETIGRSIWTAGVYDLAVTEVLYRLADRALLSVDAGANIGAMTGVLAARSAEVWAFEPHPAVFGRLAGNVARWSALPGFAPCRAEDTALGDADGEARLQAPGGFEGNQGLARLAEDPAAGGGVAVKVARLDGLAGDRRIGVLKVDVEGHELAVLRGAAAALSAGRVTNVVFENHGGADSPACRFLSGLGYELFEIGWRLNGPVLAPPGTAAARPYEAPSVLAASRTSRAAARCRRRGWECFRRRPAR